MSAFERYVLAYLKSHFAGLGAAATLLLADLDGGHDLGTLTGYQWIAIVGAAIGVGAVVAAVPNKTVVAVPGVITAVVQDDGAPAA